MTTEQDSLKIRITQDMKAAMRAGDKPRLGIIRLMLAAIKQREVDTRKELSNEQILGVLDKMVKQHRDSIDQYGKAGRQDLVDQEQFELDVIKTYLPQQLSEKEIDALIEATLAETQASTIKDMGKVMGKLKPQLQGRADLGSVSNKVKVRLAH